MCISIIIILGYIIYLLFSSAEWQLVYATYFLGIATLILGIVALYGPKWAERHLYVPKLEIFFENLSRGESEFCHKTKFGNDEPVYYFRFKVKNNGESQAKECEVVLENLWEPDPAGNPKKFQRFLPENLNMVPDFMGRVQFINLNPTRSFYCNIGHILERHPEGERYFWFDLLYSYNSQPKYLEPIKGKKYFMQYGVYSENAGSQKVCFSLSWTGNWQDGPDDMSEEIVIERVLNCPNDA